MDGLSEIGLAAGLKNGDLIRGVGAMTIQNGFDLERALWDAKPGQQVPVRVVRNGQNVTLTLTLPPSQDTTVLTASGSVHPK